MPNDNYLSPHSGCIRERYVASGVGGVGHGEPIHQPSFAPSHPPRMRRGPAHTPRCGVVIGLRL